MTKAIPEIPATIQGTQGEQGLQGIPGPGGNYIDLKPVTVTVGFPIAPVFSFGTATVPVLTGRKVRWLGEPFNRFASFGKTHKIDFSDNGSDWTTLDYDQVIRLPGLGDLVYDNHIADVLVADGRFYMFTRTAMFRPNASFTRRKLMSLTRTVVIHYS